MTQHQDETAAWATVDHEGHEAEFGGLFESVADCFARSETRDTFERMTRGMLIEWVTWAASPRRQSRGQVTVAGAGLGEALGGDADGEAGPVGGGVCRVLAGAAAQLWPPVFR